MLHQDRVWSVEIVNSIEELTMKLFETTWCGCTGFELQGYLWLNDSSSPDGAQEFGVIKQDGPDGPFCQIESITVSWCQLDELQALIEKVHFGNLDNAPWRRVIQPTLQSPSEYDRCTHCA